MHTSIVYEVLQSCTMAKIMCTLRKDYCSYITVNYSILCSRCYILIMLMLIDHCVTSQHTVVIMNVYVCKQRRRFFRIVIKTWKRWKVFIKFLFDSQFAARSACVVSDSNKSCLTTSKHLLLGKFRLRTANRAEVVTRAATGQQAKKVRAWGYSAERDAEVDKPAVSFET